jgi:hypothetical protein
MQLVAFSFLAMATALGLGAFMDAKSAFTLWRARRVAAKDVRTSSGIVDVRGKISSEQPLTAPLTGRPCAQFIVILERAAPKGGVKRDGDPDLITFVGASPFIVDDGTGRVHVDLRTARVPVTGTDVHKQPLERLTQPLDRLLQGRLHKPGGVWCMNRSVTATEAVLLEGMEVSVVAKKSADGFEPLHVTTGRTRVVAMQAMMRAGMASTAAVMLGAVWLWLR